MTLTVREGILAHGSHGGLGTTQISALTALVCERKVIQYSL